MCAWIQWIRAVHGTMTLSWSGGLRRRSVVGGVQDTLDPGPGRSIPKTGVLFPLTMLPIQRKKEAAVRPLNWQVKILENMSNKENNRITRFFLSMLTSHLLTQKHLCPFAKRSILRAYLRYVPAFSHSARGIFTEIVGKGAHHCMGDILIHRLGFLLVVSPKP